MNILKDTFENTGDLHHAYLIEGDKEAVREKLLGFIEQTLKHPIQGNPDFWHERFEMLSIDEARKLRDMQQVKPLIYKRKIFIIEVFGMTVEAQNALLKIFEEPTEGTHFFLLSDSADIFLPTLRSRMIVISDTEAHAARSGFAQEFLGASPAERLKLIEDIIETKDKAQAVLLIDGLIRALHGKKLENSASIQRELLSARSFLQDRSPSLKLILEHISLILPTI